MKASAFSLYFVSFVQVKRIFCAVTELQPCRDKRVGGEGCRELVILDKQSVHTVIELVRTIYIKGIIPQPFDFTI